MKLQRSQTVKMWKATTSIAAVLLAASMATAANAKDIYKGGLWTTFRTEATIANGNETRREWVCGVQASGTLHGQHVALTIKTWNGNLYFTIGKDGWKFPSDDYSNGVNVPLTFGFDNDERQSGTGAGIGYMMGGKYPTIEFQLNEKDGQNLIGVFLEDFAHADQMWVKFTNENEVPWRIDMKGTRGAANAFQSCLATLPNNPSAQATQPYDKGAATQPYDSNKTSSKKSGRDI